MKVELSKMKRAAKEKEPAEAAALSEEETHLEAQSQEKMHSQQVSSGHVKLLDGEQEVARLGNEKQSLILTNRRIIHLSKDAHTSRVAVVFLQDVVAARMKRSRPNKLFPAAGILLALAGLIWSLCSGFSSGFNNPTAAVILIGDMILVLVCLILYITSAGATIVFRTASDKIAFPLGREDNMYRFINHWLKLKDSASRHGG